ncbi:MAG: AraC family transcriptional regulator ligand-binding domain-containing protein [Geminicoccaceae bacterium]
MPSLAIRPGEPHPMASSLEVLVRRCAKRLDVRGHRCAPLLRAHGIALSDSADSQARLSARSEEALLRDAAMLADEPLLGWAIGDLELRDLGLYGYAALNAPDVRSALHAIVDHVTLVSENARFVLHEADGEATIAQVFSTGRCTDQASIRALLGHLSELIGPDFEPLRAGLPEQDPDRLERLSDLARTPVEGLSEPISFVSFPARLLSRRVHGADELLATVLQRLWQEEQARLAARTRALQRLQGAIVPLLPHGEPKLDAVAAKLGISIRDLRNELADLGTNLPRMTDIVRSGLVKALLAEPGMTLERAARALGYVTTDVLMKAYRRWFGTAPKLPSPAGKRDIGT